MLNSNIEFNIWYKFIIDNNEYEISKSNYEELVNLMGKISLPNAEKKFNLHKLIIVKLWNDYRKKNNIPAIMY